MKTTMALCLLASGMLAGGAGAEPYVTGTYWLVASGYRVDFVVYMVDVLDGAYGYDWGLLATDATDLVAPIGWDADVGTRKTSWWALSPGDAIPPGGVLHGCSATFGKLPVGTLYYISHSGPGPGTYYGHLQPAYIPEPAGLSAFAAMCVLTVAGIRKARWRG